MSRSLKRALAPPFAVALVALAASLALHVPAYVGLGILKALLADEPPPVPSEPMEIEIVPARPSDADETETSASDTPDEQDGVAPEPEEEPEREREEIAREEQRQEREREEEREIPTEATPAPPSRPEPTRRTSVAHRSQDPTVAPPDDAQYLAEENSRVEEETMARVRSPNQDDPDPQPAAADEPPPPSDDEGDAEDERVADLQDAEGSDERNPTREEAALPPERPREREASRSRTPQTSQAARGDGREGAAQEPGRPAEAPGGGRQASGGGERPMREVVVSDGTGSFRIRVPSERPAGEGEGEGGGLAMAGSGRGREGEGSAAGRAGRGRRRARGGGASGRGAPDLRMSWTQFSSLYGEEELQREREAWLEQRRSRTRGESRQQRWERFRAAIENYDVHVRPGNQTALNTRADPFAAYIASAHRRIHRRFAEGFLVRPPSTVGPALAANPDMHTKLEIGIDAQGRVARIGVVATSGDILFDFGAYNSVMTAQPFDATPEGIRSPDGLVYMHWSFYANHRQCGTFNAEAYILAHAPERPTTELPVPSADSIFHPRDERETPDPGAHDEDVHEHDDAEDGTSEAEPAEGAEAARAGPVDEHP